MRAWLIALGSALLAASAVLGGLGRVEGVRTEEVVMDDLPGRTLRARLYRPPGEGPFPAVLLCHGVSDSKENDEPLSLAFAQRGFVALAADFGGHGESAARPLSDRDNLSDARRALAYL